MFMESIALCSLYSLSLGIKNDPVSWPINHLMNFSCFLHVVKTIIWNISTFNVDHLWISIILVCSNVETQRYSMWSFIQGKGTVYFFACEWRRFHIPLCSCCIFQGNTLMMTHQKARKEVNQHGNTCIVYVYLRNTFRLCTVTLTFSLL